MAKGTKVTKRKGFSLGTFFIGVGAGIMLFVFIIVGVGYYLYTSFTLKKIEDLTGFDIIRGEDPEELEDKNIAELISWGSAFFSDMDSLSLAKVEDTFGYALPDSYADISLVEFKQVAITALASNINLIVDQINLSVVEGMGVSLPDMPILQENKLVPITQLFDVFYSSLTGDEATFNSLSYDFGFSLPEHPVINAIGDVPIVDLESDMDAIIMDLTLGEVLGEQVYTSTLLTSLAPFKIKDLSSEIRTLELCQLMDIEEDGSILDKLRHSQLSTIESDIKQLTVGDLVEIDDSSSSILIAIKDSTLDDLPNAISSLTTKDVLGDDDGNKLLSMLTEDEKNEPITDLPSILDNKITTMTIAEYSDLVGTPLNDAADGNFGHMTMGDLITYLNSMPAV